MNNLTQCFWHANGQLECKTINVSKNLSNESVEFNTFSNPNMNYKPNGYHDNYDYYQKSNNYCLNQNCDLPGKNNYIAPPKTYKRVAYLDGDTN